MWEAQGCHFCIWQPRQAEAWPLASKGLLGIIELKVVDTNMLMLAMSKRDATFVQRLEKKCFAIYATWDPTLLTGVSNCVTGVDSWTQQLMTNC